MSHLIGRRLLAILPLAILAVLFGAPMAAQAAIAAPATVSAGYPGDSCDATVFDGTTTQMLGNQQDINAEVAKFAAAGYTLRARALPSISQSQLKTYYKHMVNSCPSWQNARGDDLADNMLVLLLTQNHHQGIYFGSDLTGHLRASKESILSDMGTQFRESNFQSGIVVGMQDALKLMHGQSIGSESSGGSSIIGKIFVIGVASIIGLAFLGLILWAIFAFIGSVRKEMRKTAKAKDDAIQARTGANAAIERVSGATGVLDGNAVSVLVLRLTDEGGVRGFTVVTDVDDDAEQPTTNADRLQAAWDDAENKASAAYASRDALVQLGDSRDPDKVHKRDEYGTIKTAWNGVATAAEAAIAAGATVVSLYDRLSRSLDNTSADLLAVRGLLTGTREQYIAADAEGLTVSNGDNDLLAAGAAIDRAASLIEQRHFGAALDNIEYVRGLCEDVVQRITAARELKARIVQIASTAHSDVSDLSDLLDEIETALGERKGQVGFSQRVSDARELVTALCTMLGVAHPDYISFAEKLEAAQTTARQIDADSERADRRARQPRRTTTRSTGTRYVGTGGSGYGSDPLVTGLVVGGLLDDDRRDPEPFGGSDNFGNSDGAQTDW